ncbi:MAG: nickel pincer cofactor biosynthesis protein LarB [Polyangiaceae bacterium]
MAAQDDIRLDFTRQERIGLPEAIFCAGKSDEHIAEIIRQALARKANLLLTRLSRAQLDAIPGELRGHLDYEPLSRTAFLGSPAPRRNDTRIAVVLAGTSDAYAAREAARTLEFYGEPCTWIADVGVAGIWRLMERVDEIKKHPIVIAVAGMDAALPTVLGGMVSSVVIAVPTSVGYGVSTGGETALRAILASCAQGLAVTNIDNGFGAACAAMRILNAFGRGAS